MKSANSHQCASLKTLISAVTLSFVLAACGGGGGSDGNNDKTIEQESKIDYQAILNGVVSNDVPGVVLRVHSPTESFIGSAGVSDLETQEAMQTYHQQPTASSGKPMIGLLAAMLADEGRLNIDDTLEAYLSEEILDRIENSRQMTLRQLLNHTSGVFNFVEDDAYEEILLESPEVYKSAMDFLPIAFDKPAYFPPGNGYHYSNTGYLLVGLVMDEVLGEHHSIALRERILNPLGLNATYYRGIEKTLGDFVQGYHLFDGVLYQTKENYENVATANDPIVSSVEDLGHFLRSLVVDEGFINADIRELMWGESSLTNTQGNNQYGLGISIEKFRGVTAYTHAGLNYGYRTANIYIKDTDVTITAFMNCSTEPVCTNAMDSVINKVISDKF